MVGLKVRMLASEDLTGFSFHGKRARVWEIQDEVQSAEVILLCLDTSLRLPMAPRGPVGRLGFQMLRWLRRQGGMAGGRYLED